MMLNRLRLAKVLTRALPQMGNGTGISRLDMKVRWADCDINRHMNNARYLSIMDLGRWDLTVRSGLLPAALRARMQPVVVGLEITYRRELKPGERYVLETWFSELEGRKLHFGQRFLKDGGETLCAEGSVTALLLKEGRVATAPVVQEVFADLGIEVGEPAESTSSAETASSPGGRVLRFRRRSRR